ncbi:ABC transporter substrate-binding protein [Cohaesibacter gelatinilyticus]|uniref:Amino acid/amide ABC transporter substrate-binding protein, HAAT family n=1 Tax=Cohaesibacter gelatinilyticus TaxID=372072 RepID=A0A285PD19_9HYPH|nr:ABC transporter substrate-binding protein [Cohaesibacter gelatinilyticus]SNZ19655.1 amino acid/amide ABC transporter substrate-binding protein, HAAT family [Cohaesibacter gelatinilyticus]
MMGSSIRRNLFAGWILVLTCVFHDASLAQAETRPASVVKVGCLYPLTGPGGLYGRDSAIAIEMAQDFLRSSTDKAYPVLDVSIEDTRSKTLRSIQIARKFIEEDKVAFLCGVVSSNIARAVSERARESETFFIGTDHASPSLISEALHPFYFRVNNGTRLSMLAGAKYIKQKYEHQNKPLKIAFIGPDYDYGYQAWEDLRAFLSSMNMELDIRGEYWSKLFETDFITYIQQLSRSDIDIVVSGHWGLDLVTFVKQANQLGLFNQTQIMNFDAGGNYEILAELGNDMPLGMVLSARHHLNWPPTKRNREFVEAFREKAGRYPSYAAQGAYTGILAIAQAVHQAGGVADKEAIRVALEGLKLNLPEDPEGFQSYMDPDSHQMMQVQAIGRTMFNNNFPPATSQLGEWSIYYPPKAWPRLDGDGSNSP